MDSVSQSRSTMRSLVISVVTLTVAAVAVSKSNQYSQELYDYVQCQVCQTPELTGGVKDSCCNYETVDKALDEHFHPILQELTTLSYFRYFKIDLSKQCPYWNDEGMCSSRECAVCECPPEEIPRAWFKLDNKRKNKEKYDMPACDTQSGTGDLSRVDRANAKAGENFDEWSENRNDLWIYQDGAGGEMMYVNLLENPERFTGYSGAPAERIWHAIYEENCFKPPSGSGQDLHGMCLEERVFYRLISGLQASINTHIALEYKFSNSEWGMNTPLFVFRVGKHPERLQNLYFTYLFVMRAVGKARRLLMDYDYTTGNDDDDKRTRELINALVNIDDTSSSCPQEGKEVLKGFDESTLFRVDTKGLSYDQAEIARHQKKELELQFRTKFENITRIMNCVTCEKCRLWGTIQVMGIGTAIKLILSEETNFPHLQRSEIIALINVLTRLSESVDGVRMFRELEFQIAQQQACFVIGLVLSVIILVAVLSRRSKMKKID